MREVKGHRSVNIDYYILKYDRNTSNIQSIYSYYQLINGPIHFNSSCRGDSAPRRTTSRGLNVRRRKYYERHSWLTSSLQPVTLTAREAHGFVEPPLALWSYANPLVPTFFVQPHAHGDADGAFEEPLQRERAEE